MVWMADDKVFSDNNQPHVNRILPWFKSMPETTTRADPHRDMHTLSFLSWRAYGKLGMMAVMRSALAYLQALIMISSSIRLSFTSPDPHPTINTSSPRTETPISTLGMCVRSAAEVLEIDWPNGKTDAY